MSIVFNRVGFEWPNGRNVFEDLSFSLGKSVSALIGPNGVGKSTLAHLIEGRLEPTQGSILRSENEVVLIFHQSDQPPEESVETYLGEGVGHQALSLQLLRDVDRARLCSRLSGGEWTRVRLSKVAESETDFVILDEPTNHLDRGGREAVAEFMRGYTGGLLLISHDRELLEEADQILELSAHGMKVFGFGWSDYVVERDRERESLRKALESAQRERDRSAKKRHDKIEAQEKRYRKGEELKFKGGVPKILLGGMKRRAQVTSGKIDAETRTFLDSTVSEAWEAYQDLKIDPVMYARLPELGPSGGKLIAEALDFNFRFAGSDRNLWRENLNFTFRAPSKVAIRGPNGSGKSTLLKLIQGFELEGLREGRIGKTTLRSEYLSQDHSNLEGDLSILENVRSSAVMNESDVRGLLAMFLFANESVHQNVSTLSGGETLRAALAKAFLSTPPAQLLFLDEPTNNLDLVNIEFLENLLKQYQGSLVVVSHDERFLNSIGLTGEIVLRKT